MAEIQLSIPYNTVLTRQGKVLAWTLWPLWALLAPLCLLLTLAAIAIYPAMFVPTTTAMLILVPVLLMVAGAAWTAVCQEDRIYVSNEGIYFPQLLTRRIGEKYVPWDRVAAADVDDTGQRKNLRLVVRGIGAIKFDLADVPEQDIEQLLLAIELWGEKCERTPVLIAYQHEIQNATKGLERVSYTQMWEDELSRKFSTTTFVPLEPGAALRDGRLKVCKQLSFGGFSAIYLAQDELGAFIVVKEAVVPSAADEKVKEKAEEHFAREAAFLTRLSHDGIAKVYDHFSENGRSYILLEYIEGQNLRQVVNQNGPLDNKTAIAYALELAQVLDYLHQQSPPIIHRDFSPDNIMLRPSGKLVLIDFGAANNFVSAATGTLVGKQAYMPAEQLRGKAVIQSDYYSYGGTLHFLMTGADPVPLESSSPKQLNNNVNEALDALVSEFTAFEASDRLPADKSLYAYVSEKLGPVGAMS